MGFRLLISAELRTALLGCASFEWSISLKTVFPNMLSSHMVFRLFFDKSELYANIFDFLIDFLLSMVDETFIFALILKFLGPLCYLLDIFLDILLLALLVALSRVSFV